MIRIKKIQHRCCFWMIIIEKEVTSKTTKDRIHSFAVLNGFEQTLSFGILFLMIFFLLKYHNILVLIVRIVFRYIIWKINTKQKIKHLILVGSDYLKLKILTIFSEW